MIEQLKVFVIMIIILVAGIALIAWINSSEKAQEIVSLTLGWTSVGGIIFGLLYSLWWISGAITAGG